MLIVIDKVISLEEWQIILSQDSLILLKADGIYNLSLTTLSNNIEKITNLKLYVLKDDLQARQLKSTMTFPFILLSLKDYLELIINHSPIFHYRKIFAV